MVERRVGSDTVSTNVVEMRQDDLMMITQTITTDCNETRLNQTIVIETKEEAALIIEKLTEWVK